MTWTVSRRSLSLFSAAGLSLAVVGTTAACRAADTPVATAAAAMPAGQAGAPMLINCAPGQQPLVRQVAINGAWVPQVECVATGVQAMQPVASGTAPAAGYVQAAPMYAPAAPAYTAPAPAYASAPIQTQAPVYVPAPVAASRPAARRVVYDDDVVEYRSPKRGRSWKKSAIIIGSSAGVGAGVGAATGGKKGALIGAAIGGGGATIWDQATRR